MFKEVIGTAQVGVLGAPDTLSWPRNLPTFTADTTNPELAPRPPMYISKVHFGILT
jgi:hypothetical protein